MFFEVISQQKFVPPLYLSLSWMKFFPYGRSNCFWEQWWWLIPGVYEDLKSFLSVTFLSDILVIVSSYKKWKEWKEGFAECRNSVGHSMSVRNCTQKNLFVVFIYHVGVSLRISTRNVLHKGWALFEPLIDVGRLYWDFFTFIDKPLSILGNVYYWQYNLCWLSLDDLISTSSVRFLPNFTVNSIMIIITAPHEDKAEDIFTLRLFLLTIFGHLLFIIFYLICNNCLLGFSNVDISIFLPKAF